MSSKIKQLRESKDLENAYREAKIQLSERPNDIYYLRDMAWVLYDFLKLRTEENKHDSVIKIFKNIADLNIPDSEEMFFNSIAFFIPKWLKSIKTDSERLNTFKNVFPSIKKLPFKRPHESYSVLLNGLHKFFKNDSIYIEIIDWWGLGNFLPNDYEEYKLENGKNILSLVEQVYTAYPERLLMQENGKPIFDKDKILAFLPNMDSIIEKYPKYKWPPYKRAKLKLAIGNADINEFIPFAKRNAKNSWVWQIIAEYFPKDEEKKLSCYCKALTCKDQDEMMVKIRKSLAEQLINRQLYNEAKTEIILISNIYVGNNWNVPIDVLNWQNEKWYSVAEDNKNNFAFYDANISIAEKIVFGDLKKNKIVVNRIDLLKDMFYFVTTENIYGGIKNKNLIKKLKIGDVLEVNGLDGKIGESFRCVTINTIKDQELANQFVKLVEGNVSITGGKFGFIVNYYVPESIILRYKLFNGQKVKARAVKSYNKKKESWGWSVFEII